MRFFTPELLERYRAEDPTVARAGEAEWEAAHARYEAHIQSLEAGWPASLRDFATLLLHDAALQSLGREGGRLLMVLKKDIPPRDLVILSYELEEEPLLIPFARSHLDWHLPTRFDFDELDCIPHGDRQRYTQSIVFANGWEMQVQFRDVQVIVAALWSPANGIVSQSSPATSLPA